MGLVFLFLAKDSLKIFENTDLLENQDCRKILNKIFYYDDFLQIYNKQVEMPQFFDDVVNLNKLQNIKILTGITLKEKIDLEINSGEYVQNYKSKYLKETDLALLNFLRNSWYLKSDGNLKDEQKITLLQLEIERSKDLVKKFHKIYDKNLLNSEFINDVDGVYKLLDQKIDKDTSLKEKIDLEISNKCYYVNTLSTSLNCCDLAFLNFLRNSWCLQNDDNLKDDEKIRILQLEIQNNESLLKDIELNIGNIQTKQNKQFLIEFFQDSVINYYKKELQKLKKEETYSQERIVPNNIEQIQEQDKVVNNIIKHKNSEVEHQNINQKTFTQKKSDDIILKSEKEEEKFNFPDDKQYQVEEKLNLNNFSQEKANEQNQLYNRKDLSIDGDKNKSQEYKNADSNQSIYILQSDKELCEYTRNSNLQRGDNICCWTYFIQDENLSQMENEVVEYKNYQNIDYFQVKRNICAYLNHMGGTIFFGIEDQQLQVKAMYMTNKYKDNFKNQILNLLKKDWYPEIELNKQVKVEFVPVMSQKRQWLPGFWVPKIQVKSKLEDQVYIFLEKSYPYCYQRLDGQVEELKGIKFQKKVYDLAKKYKKDETKTLMHDCQKPDQEGVKSCAVTKEIDQQDFSLFKEITQDEFEYTFDSEYVFQHYQQVCIQKPKVVCLNITSGIQNQDQFKQRFSKVQKLIDLKNSCDLIFENYLDLMDTYSSINKQKQTVRDLYLGGSNFKQIIP
ncbi:hypothetical protein PPERSA_09279 [Pseudocohnilembus persalinus]|uniref:Schlafen AlbA-2 domain-containing protein n=1 Tax=Pseudocohnilembus persalinus TaxID=266149 RepID=A0A0V0QLM0_PSEPJ|nr:hypothetical protein PPERSA_09279 [Pseudocohnilembus persalinus]|eukprot:KRX03219.1 hypothetical protein PPERSA_09279 [Pseudocohnilembus persalinus]